VSTLLSYCGMQKRVIFWHKKCFFFVTEAARMCVGDIQCERYVEEHLYQDVQSSRCRPAEEAEFSEAWNQEKLSTLLVGVFYA